ncbi:MAG: hypothetical protein IPI02_18240 [Sterolibacteriaceae bacterium]|nr:hypothetical protein [Sterolibacteriaceae bacterium]
MSIVKRMMGRHGAFGGGIQQGRLQNPTNLLVRVEMRRSLVLPGRTRDAIADGQDRHPRIDSVHRF